MGRCWSKNCIDLSETDPRGLVEMVIKSRIPPKYIDGLLGFSKNELAQYIGGSRKINPVKYEKYFEKIKEIIKNGTIKYSNLLPPPPGPRFVCEACCKPTYSRHGREGKMLCERCHKRNATSKIISKTNRKRLQCSQKSL